MSIAEDVMNAKEKKSIAGREHLNKMRADPSFEAKRREGLERYYASLRAGERSHRKAKPDVQGVAERMAELTAEEIVGAIQTRINDLTAENGRLREELAECRIARQNADRDVFDLRKENRDLAAQLRSEKDRRGGLRLFAGQSR